MKRYFFLVLLLVVFSGVNGQDVIVTNDQDTIDCKITRVTDEFIHFSIFDKSGVLLMRSRLPMSQVQSFQQAEVEPVKEPLDQPSEKKENPPLYDDFEPAKFRLSANTGFTYQLGGYEGLPSSYREQLQSLWSFGGELHYFLSDKLGIGAKYNYVFTNANEDFEPPFSTAFGFSSIKDEKVQFTYLGLSVLLRDILYDDQTVNYFIAGGIINYRTDLLADGIPYFQEGNTFGFALGVGYDFILLDNFGVGIGLEVNIARLSEYNDNGNIVAADFSLTRIDLTAGIRLFK